MGLEIVRDRIISDANKQAERIIAAAKAEAEKILDEAESEICAEAANYKAKAEAETQKISNQIISSAKLEARFRILQGKRNGIDGIMESVHDELRSMKPPERASFIERTISGLKLPGGKYEIDCAERDLERIDKKRLDEISKGISADGEAVVIKKGSPVPISGGFILRSETADYDFSIESILRSRQAEIEAMIVKSIFGEAPEKKHE